ncbi:MAG TPA: hypothetical protein DCS66_14320 [Flavobacteriaceae bacterium]|nr:hypothetical protein [Flavobacteriaceae bacterium]|tara:strand:- start:412 stop:690 length:279 start_codon:yes stop_codon:yes gene_type:complete
MSNDFVIDSKFAIPEDFHTATRKYPFEDMSVGDSFFAGPNYADETQKQIGNRVAQARQAYRKRLAKQDTEVEFTQRMWSEEGYYGYRVWRVK